MGFVEFLFLFCIASPSVGQVEGKARLAVDCWTELHLVIYL